MLAILSRCHLVWQIGCKRGTACCNIEYVSTILILHCTCTRSVTYSSTEALFQGHYILMKTWQNHISSVKYAELGCSLLGCDCVDCGFVAYILGLLTLNLLDYSEDGSSKLLRNVGKITNQHCIISKNT